MAYVDCDYHDADFLAANGWVPGPWVGATSARPVKDGPSSGNPHRASRGLVFIDTTLGKTLVFNESNWVDALTGAAA